MDYSELQQRVAQCEAEIAKEIIGRQKREQLNLLRESLKEFAEAGITRTEIENCLDEVYRSR